MFSNLFSGASLYIILALLASTAGFGYLSYSLSNDKAVAVAQLKDANDAIVGYKKDAELKDLSCKIDDLSASELTEDKNKIDEAISPINDQLRDLAAVKKIPNKAVSSAAILPKETTKDESNFLPDDGLLSPNVKRLLNNGWCSVYPDSNQCLPTRQSSDKPL
jgi:hypothetical protein